ncbi:neurogenic protein big brain-like isoform X1 [Portunus trituberculatus]|uniref:neurogenic protein big brain-like isoform X1 n=1 Tax=Portunus trituberculatus TaxID=210409 RepID=UPI001E1CF3F2|nr:neurogenic protein big brain-like isoform X1 [Portunus trituberculatus]
MASTTGGGGGSAMDAQLVALLDKLEGLRQEVGPPPRLSMIAEVRTLELWRAVIAECLATVFYVFLVCGAYSPWTGKVLTQDGQLTVALVAGFTMAILVHSFGQVSGGHINPAVTVSLAVTRHVSPLRAAMFVLAQLGGGIAGAALLYGATSSGYTGDLGATSVSQVITQWQGLGLEFLLTFVVVFVFFSSVNPYRRSFGNPSVVIGFAYMACTLVGLPLTGASMNPARSLGPAFVKNKWDAHWVYWVAPLVGGMTGGLIYEYIFNPHRVPRSRKDSMDGDSSSVGSDEDPYDECSKPPPRYNYNALHAQNYDQYRPANTSNTTSPLGYPASMYEHNGATSVCNASAYKYDNGYVKDDIYSGSKSLYTKSPPLPRSSSLNRSQSVYAKPPPPRMDNYNRNLTHSQSLCPKSATDFSTLPHTDNMYKSNPRRDTLYVTSKSGIVKPEPVYGTSYNKQNDSGDSNYSTYRGTASYSSSRSSNPGPPVPMSRTRTDNLTPNSVASAHSSLVTPNSAGLCYSPNPQY